MAAHPGRRLREVTRLDRSRVAIAAAASSAIGYAIPLVAGLATGQIADGVAASAGALIVGFANLDGGYRVRVATLLATTLAGGVAALVGGFTGPSVLATVVVLGAWGFASGLLVALGSRTALVGMLSTWTLLLAGDLNLRGQAVLQEAWLITAGGLVQMMVALAAWPLRPFAAERRAVGNAYQALAAYARAPTTAALQSTAAALAAATETVGANSAQTGERGALRTLVEQGEWVRLELAALARSHVPGVDATLRAAANALDNVPRRRESTTLARGSQPQRTTDRRAGRAPACSATHRLDRGRRRPQSRRRAWRGGANAPGPRVARRAHAPLQRVSSRNAPVVRTHGRRDRIPKLVARLGLLGPADGSVRAQARLWDHDRAWNRAGYRHDGRRHDCLGDCHAVLAFRRRDRSPARALSRRGVRGLSLPTTRCSRLCWLCSSYCWWSSAAARRSVP